MLVSTLYNKEFLGRIQARKGGWGMKMVLFRDVSPGDFFQWKYHGASRLWWRKTTPSRPIYSHAEQRYVCINAEHIGPAGQYTAREIGDETLVWVEEE